MRIFISVTKWICIILFGLSAATAILFLILCVPDIMSLMRDGIYPSVEFAEKICITIGFTIIASLMRVLWWAQEKAERNYKKKKK